MNRHWVKWLPAPLSSRLEGRPGLQGILGNTGWHLADKALRLGVGLLVGVWVARYLGPGGFGALSFAQAFVALFATCASLGLDSIVVRDIVRHPGSKEETLGSAFLLKLAGGIICLLLTALLSGVMYAGDRLTQLLVTVIACGTIFQAFDVVDFWFQSQVNAKYTVCARNAAFLLISGVKIVLVLKKAPLVMFALAGLSEIALGALGLVLAYRLSGHSLASWRPRKARAAQLLSASWPLILSGLAVMIYLRIDQVMLKHMVSDQEVGFYSAALRISEVWYVIPGAIVSSVFPSIIETKQSCEVTYQAKLQNLHNVMTAISLSISLPISLLAANIIHLLYGPSYHDSALILTISIWTSFFVFHGVARGPWIIAEGLQKFSFFSLAAGAVANVVLNLFLIPLYQAKGAVLATLLTQIIVTMLAPLILPQTRPSVLRVLRSFFLLPRW